MLKPAETDVPVTMTKFALCVFSLWLISGCFAPPAVAESIEHWKCGPFDIRIERGDPAPKWEVDFTRRFNSLRRNSLCNGTGEFPNAYQGKFFKEQGIGTLISGAAAR
jgi:hypothetical protein